jgi:hypothetical protein
VAVLFEGNVALLALPLTAAVAAAAAAAAGASVARRAAVGTAVVLLGGYAGFVAHGLLYDHSAVTAHWSMNRLVVRGVVALVLAGGVVAFANRRQARTRP